MTSNLPHRTGSPDGKQKALFEAALEADGGALARLACAYEVNSDRQRDLLQEIHLSLWKSMAGFDGRCSLRTWVFRVAHNVASSHVRRERSRGGALLSLEEVAEIPAQVDVERTTNERHALERLYTLVRRLKPPDAQVMLLYLEGLSASAVAEVTGLTSSNVATRIHRIKKVLAEQFNAGANHG